MGSKIPTLSIMNRYFERSQLDWRSIKARDAQDATFWFSNSFIALYKWKTDDSEILVTLCARKKSKLCSSECPHKSSNTRVWSSGDIMVRGWKLSLANPVYYLSFSTSSEMETRSVSNPSDSFMQAILSTSFSFTGLHSTFIHLFSFRLYNNNIWNFSNISFYLLALTSWFNGKFQQFKLSNGMSPSAFRACSEIVYKHLQ